MKTIFSENHQPQLKLSSQNQNHNQRRKKLNQLPSQLLSSTLRLKIPKLILTLWPRRSWKDKSTVWSGTTNQRKSTLPTEFKNSKWVVSLKTPKSLLTTFSNPSKLGKKFNLLIWSACKNCDLLYNYSHQNFFCIKWILMLKTQNINHTETVISNFRSSSIFPLCFLSIILFKLRMMFLTLGSISLFSMKMSKTL